MSTNHEKAETINFPQAALTMQPRFTIPAERARGIAEAAQAAQAQQRELERIQLIQRVRYLEALLSAAGINPDGFDIMQAADGSWEVKEKPAEAVS